MTYMSLRLFPLLYEAESNQDRTWALGARWFFALVWLHQVRKVNRSVHHVFPPTKTATIPYTLYLLTRMFWGLIIKWGLKWQLSVLQSFPGGRVGRGCKRILPKYKAFSTTFLKHLDIAKFNLILSNCSCTKQWNMSPCWEGKREGRSKNINPFPYTCLYINLRDIRKRAARPEATKSMRSDTFLWGACRRSQHTFIPASKNSC